MIYLRAAKPGLFTNLASFTSFSSITLSLSILAHGRTAHGRRAHLGEDPIQPLQGSVEVHFNPARGGSDSLATVFGAPALDKTHANGALSGQLVDSLKALIDRLRQQGGKLLVVEDLQVGPSRNFAHLKEIQIESRLSS